ncbi:MAG: nuclear transport factor 2 family protein [Novosphingobium sp.]
MSAHPDRATAVAIARRFLDRMAAMDYDAVTAMLTDDCVVEMPFSPGPQLHRGPAEFHAAMQFVPDFCSRMSFAIQNDAYDPETGRVTLEYTSDCTRTDGRPYANRYVGLWDIAGDKVRCWKEFYNPVLLA